jgi:hypothetical protein
MEDDAGWVLEIKDQMATLSERCGNIPRPLRRTPPRTAAYGMYFGWVTMVNGGIKEIHLIL